MTRSHFKKYKTLYRKVIRKSKEMYNAMPIRNVVNKRKEAWKIIKEMENTNPEEKDALNRFNLGEELFMLDKHAIAQEIIFFSQNLESKKLGIHKRQWSVMQENIILSCFSHPATTESVIKIIDELKNKMTCGPDLLPSRIIKEVKCEIAELLSKRINESKEFVLKILKKPNS